MNLNAELAAGMKFVSGLPAVLDYNLIGSAMYLPDPNDVDFAVLIEPDRNAIEYAEELVGSGWGHCGEYDNASGTWAAVRRDKLNLMITHDPKFFTGYRTAMEVCKALNLQHKQDRIAVCQIVRDGKTADQVTTHNQLKE